MFNLGNKPHTYKNEETPILKDIVFLHQDFGPTNCLAILQSFTLSIV